MENQDLDDRLEQAITAINSGDNESGKRLIHEVLEGDPRHEKAWLWLAIATTDPLEKRHYLHRVLEINPNNETAKNELAHLEAENKSSEPSNPAANAAAVVGIIGVLLFLNGLQEFLGNSNVLGLGSGIGGIALVGVARWLSNAKEYHGWGAIIANLVIGVISLLLIVNGVIGFLNSDMMGLGLGIAGIALGGVVWWLLNTEN